MIENGLIFLLLTFSRSKSNLNVIKMIKSKYTKVYLDGLMVENKIEKKLFQSCYSVIIRKNRSKTITTLFH
jgi:hypothetical protein